MPRWLTAATACGLFACADTLEDRLAQLDDRATVDCGFVSDCDAQARTEAAVACLWDNLAAGVGAKAELQIDLDPVAFVYALDDSFVSVEGYYEIDGGHYFTEYRCHNIAVTLGQCSHARPSECEEIREW